VRLALALACAISGCALVHERGGDAGPIVAMDAAPIARDTTPPVIDAGPIGSCTDFWNGLPSCPAAPERALGQPCFPEGATCGVHCCEPGPPIGCSGGRWSPLDHMDDCSGVRCRGPHPCGGGMCSASRVCLVADGEVALEPRCALPPAPMNECSEAPPGSLTSDPRSCTTCSCTTSVSGDPLVTLDCACC
jgi:hypothetical protein